jgi:hypothetical protein
MAMPEPDRVQREVLPEESEELQMKPVIQREELPEEDELQMKPIAEGITPIVQREVLPEEEIQAKPTPHSPFPTPDLESRLNSSEGGGSPLSSDVRSFMEPRFGTDFSQVRVHTGSDAVQMNQELGAQAFTHGAHIYYGAGKAPAKDELTGHELTHVVQQSAIAKTQTQSKPQNQFSTSGPVIQMRRSVSTTSLEQGKRTSNPVGV